MGATHFTLRIAAEHACDFGDTIVTAQDRDVSGGDAALGSLADEDVMVRTRGNLRQMRDREYLMVARDAAHCVAHLQADASTDARVHFVEDERGHTIQPGEDRLEREHHTRELAA